MTSIFPSLISSDLLDLEQEIKLLEPYCAGFHLDVMDFDFVPNLTFGPDFINQIRKKTEKQLQIHLMVQYPEKYLNRLKLNKNDIVILHIESHSNVKFSELIYTIKSLNLIPSVALNPNTPIDNLVSLHAPLEHVLLMSVNPGFSGQMFLPHSVNKLKAINNFRIANGLNFIICVDGGINASNYKDLIQNGANQLAVASAIFNSKDKIQAIKKLQ